MTSYWDVIRHREKKGGPKFNIIGFPSFASSPWKPTKRCPHHPGHRLVGNRNLETGEQLPGLMCPACGSQFLDNEPTATEENIKGKFKGKQETKIISAKGTRKKHTDKQGNEINDETLLKDIENGANVIYYHEEKSGEETQIDSKNRRIIRSKKS
jgi:hypothetical protein